MAELRAGGLALVIGLKEYARFNGKCVQLVMMVRPGEIYKSPVTELRWRHECNNSSWVAIGDVEPVHGKEKGWSIFNPKNLIPIDGDDFSHEREHERELING